MRLLCQATPLGSSAHQLQVRSRYGGRDSAVLGRCLWWARLGDQCGSFDVVRRSATELDIDRSAVGLERRIGRVHRANGGHHVDCRVAVDRRIGVGVHERKLASHEPDVGVLSGRRRAILASAHDCGLGRPLDSGLDSVASRDDRRECLLKLSGILKDEHIVDELGKVRVNGLDGLGGNEEVEHDDPCV